VLPRVSSAACASLAACTRSDTSTTAGLTRRRYCGTLLATSGHVSHTPPPSRYVLTCAALRKAARRRRGASAWGRSARKHRAAAAMEGAQGGGDHHAWQLLDVLWEPVEMVRARARTILLACTAFAATPLRLAAAPLAAFGAGRTCSGHLVAHQRGLAPPLGARPVSGQSCGAGVTRARRFRYCRLPKPRPTATYRPSERRRCSRSYCPSASSSIRRRRKTATCGAGRGAPRPLFLRAPQRRLQWRVRRPAAPTPTACVAPTTSAYGTANTPRLRSQPLSVCLPARALTSPLCAACAANTCAR
jgi:hypothetical protein